VLGVTPDARARIKPGQAARLVDLDAPDDAIAATILSVGGMADPKTGLFTVVAKPAEDKASDLLSGAHLRATVETEGMDGWIVPRDAVLTDDMGPYVFQVDGGKAARIGVTILGGAEDRLAVSGPIDPKKKLVTAGNYELADGGAVREQGAEPDSKEDSAPAAKPKSE
jgi:hypothetical protein